MSVGIIYYTHGNIKKEILAGVQKQIAKSGLPITSCTLSPMDFGDNIVLNETKGAIAMFKQILAALEHATQDYIFFCEHDVLYHPTHFDFTPERDDVFYYNTNVWRWDYYSQAVTTYDHLVSVSGLCVNRLHAIVFYKKRIELIYEHGYDKLPTFGNPLWARTMGYEPGKYGNKEEPATIEEWKAPYPNIDIRHTRSMTAPKMTYDSFKKKPINWKEDVIDNLPGWDKPWLLVR